MQHFIDPTAWIGKGTKVWHFAVIQADARIGEDCNIGSLVEVGRGCIIGARSRISSGVFLPAHSQIGHDVFIGPGVIFTDDRYPRANTEYTPEPPVVGYGASIGAGSVILPGVTIGAGAMIGAGSVVAKSVPPMVVIRGPRASIERRLANG